MGTLYQMSIVTGILVSYCINYLLRDLGPTAGAGCSLRA